MKAHVIGWLCLAQAGLGAAAWGRSVPPPWRVIAVGVEYATFQAPKTRIEVKDDKLHVVRIDPRRVRLVGVVASAADRKPRTTAEWAKRRRLLVATNLGMYQQDHLTHVGYLRVGGHVNSGHWVPSYRSLLTFGTWRCRHAPTGRKIMGLSDGGRLPNDEQCYEAVVQNLRLIAASADSRGGKSVWSGQRKGERRWSEAALAQDGDGRLLFLFCRTPLTMPHFNRFVLGLPLGIVRAMHLEGGPEASLSIHGQGVDLDLAGSFETGFLPRDDNEAQWPIPNVLGVRATGATGLPAP